MEKVQKELMKEVRQLGFKFEAVEDSEIARELYTGPIALDLPSHRAYHYTTPWRRALRQSQDEKDLLVRNETS